MRNKTSFRQKVGGSRFFTRFVSAAAEVKTVAAKAVAAVEPGMVATAAALVGKSRSFSRYINITILTTLGLGARSLDYVGTRRVPEESSKSKSNYLLS